MAIGGHFELGRVEFFQNAFSPEPYNLFYSNGVDILSGFHDIPQYQACRGEYWRIGDHFEFYQPEIFQDASSPETLQFI